jgi:hypothetical protein
MLRFVGMIGLRLSTRQSLVASGGDTVQSMMIHTFCDKELAVEQAML